MKAILIDDEVLSLTQLQIMLERELGGVDVIGTYSDPLEALEKAVELQPDVVFLDINMPGIDGLELAEKFQSSMPYTEIVFVTAYKEYAVNAFDLSAMDYIMKPILLERLRRTVKRLQMRLQEGEQKGQDSGWPYICCFSHIMFQQPGMEPQLVKWRTAKAQELFAYLLHHRDQIIDREVITDLLWPDIDTSKAVQQLYTTIYNIRQTLKNSGMDGVSISSMGAEGGYVLKLGNTLIDKEVWETQLLQAEALDENNISEHEQLLNMYKGDYFGGYGYLWAEYEKERLRRMWLSLARKISSFYIEHDSPDRAIQVNYRIQQCNPLEEESYFTLMKLFDSLGNRTGVREQYKILTSRLEQELGAAPDDQIITWFKQWSRNS